MNNKCDLLLQNCSVLQADYSISEQMSIAVLDGTIVEIGTAEALSAKYQAVQVLRGEGKLAMPGMIDGHTHISQQLLRGKLSDEYPVLYLRFNLPYENRLDAQDMRICTELACLEMIKGGITTFSDAGADFLEEVTPVIVDSGLRAVLTRPSSDMGEHLPAGRKDSTAQALKKSEEMYRAVHGMGEGRISVFFQFRSVSSCTEALIRGMVELAREYETGIHTHMSEYPNSNLHCLQTYGMREVEYLDSIGAFEPHFVAAHGIQLSEEDIQIFSRNEVNVVHCPRSNLGKGVTKTPQLLSHGVEVAFGTDGTAHAGLSMFREMTAFKHSQMIQWGVPYCDYRVMSAKRLLKILLEGGARALGFGSELGALEPGKKADFITIDLDQVHISPTHSIVNTLTESVDVGDVRDMVVDGKLIMHEREVLTLDEERIMTEASEALKRVAQNNNWKG